MKSSFVISISILFALCTNTLSAQITVDGGPDQYVCEGDVVILNATGGVTYVWDNGVTNGVPFLPAVTTTYTVVGTDAVGNTGSDQVTVFVGPVPTSTFDWYQDSSTTQTVIMINNSVGGNGNPIASYLWDFGDGSTSTQAYPSHTYNTTGTFQVCLTVTDDTYPTAPCTATYCDSVYVTFKQVGFTINVYSPEVLSMLEIEHSTPKELVKIVDMMGRETEDKPNTTIIYIYSDGTTKKVYRVE